jgi:hypothetical protein
MMKKPLSVTIMLLMTAGVVTTVLSATPAEASSGMPPSLAASSAKALAKSSDVSTPSTELRGAGNALNQLSEMKIRQAVLEESLKNIQIESQIAALRKKMGVSSGVSSSHIPLVSLLTCSSANHCEATLLLPDGARVPAYTGTAIGDGMKVVGITDHGVLAASGAHRFYLPLAGDAAGGAAGSNFPVTQQASLPPVPGGSYDSPASAPSAMTPAAMPSAAMNPAPLPPAGMP